MKEFEEYLVWGGKPIVDENGKLKIIVGDPPESL
jgi:hypothetical protein